MAILTKAPIGIGYTSFRSTQLNISTFSFKIVWGTIDMIPAKNDFKHGGEKNMLSWYARADIFMALLVLLIIMSSKEGGRRRHVKHRRVRQLG